MCSKINIQECSNYALLPEHCVASFFNFFVIGKPNFKDLGFNENEYIKIRYTDFEAFSKALESMLAFVASENEDKSELEIVRTPSYVINWKGRSCAETGEKKVCISANFHQINQSFILDFDMEDIHHLINGFWNIAVDVFCFDALSKAALKLFLHNVTQQVKSVEYVEHLSRLECERVSRDICDCLEAPKINAYLITDKIMGHKTGLKVLTELRDLYSENVINTIISTAANQFSDNSSAQETDKNVEMEK